MQVDIDFPYKYDDNGNPILLVPNMGRARQKRIYTKVEYDQTATHMHHAPDFGIVLPQNFDMTKYMRLDRSGRIEYANQKLPRETIINYQNEIGKSIFPLFVPVPKEGPDFMSVPGYAGEKKIGTELTIAPVRSDPDKFMLGIIREDGTHISSFAIGKEQLKKLALDDFWVLKKRNL